MLRKIGGWNLKPEKIEKSRFFKIKDQQFGRIYKSQWWKNLKKKK